MDKKMLRGLLRWSLGALSLLPVFFLGGPLEGQELTRRLTAEDVACNERQLARLLQRMTSGNEVYVTPQLANTLFVTPTGLGGGYTGLITTFELFRLGPGEIPPAPSFEHYLAFNVSARGRTLLLNPSREPLPQVSLSREAASSNLVEPGRFFDLTLTLDPGPGGGGVLAINNFVEPRTGEAYNGFLSSSTKPGRGLKRDGLLEPCHDKLTEFDRHVFSILQRVVRVAAMSEFFAPDVEAAVFRGEDPHTYRINFYPIYEEFEARGRMSIELRIEWTEAGKLTTGVARVLPTCSAAHQLGCSNLQRSALQLYLIQPVFGGREHASDAGRQDGGYYLSDQGPSEPHPLDFAALLANSTWNEPVW